MKITSIHLKNFIGIYQGTGLTEIKIDFNKANSSIILLSGINGSGKSTLLNTLHPFAQMFDNCGNEFDMILPDKNGLKEIEFKNGKNEYKIIHHYNRSKSTKSFTIKSEFFKKENKKWINLNESGKQGLFSELVEEYLNCTSNILQISRLGANLNSFITRKSTERKEYISQFLPNIDEYMKFYKIITNKIQSSKVLLKVITNNLDNLGSLEDIKNNLKDTENNIRSFKEKVNGLNKKVSVIDYNLENLRSLNEIRSEINRVKESLNEKYEVIDKEILDNEEFENTNEEELDDLISEKEKEKSKLESEIEKLKGINQTLTEPLLGIDNQIFELEKILDDAKDEDLIPKYERELKNINSDLKELRDKIKIYEKKISSSKLEITYSGIEELQAMKLELETLSNYIKSNIIAEIPDSWSGSISDLYKSNELDKLKEFVDEYDTNNEMIPKLDIQLEKFNLLEDKIEILKDRPDDCSIDGCIFIKDALLAKEKLKERSKIEKKKEKIQNYLDENKKEYDDASLVLSIRKRIEDYYKLNIKFKNIIQLEDLFQGILNNTVEKKLKVIETYIDRHLLNYFEENLITNKTLKENQINTIKKAITSNEKIVNTIKELRANQKESREKIKSNTLKLASLSSEVRKIDSEIITYRNYFECKKLLEEYKELKNERDEIKSKCEEKEELLEEIKELEDSIKSEDSKRIKYNTDISNYTENIKKKESLDKDFHKLDLLKNSLSPTTGIPLIYIGEFLEYTKEKANYLLSKIYDNKYSISNFIIDEKEFAIQIQKKDRELIPDIRRCSEGEKSMTGISISFAILEQSLSKYNIICLDELDSQLDEKNRQTFIDILQLQLNTMNIEQCFIISHNPYFEDLDINVVKFNGSSINLPKNKVLAIF